MESEETIPKDKEEKAEKPKKARKSFPDGYKKREKKPKTNEEDKPRKKVKQAS